MSLTVDFWEFSKIENSTSIPTSTPDYTFTNILLKENCSLVNPALKVSVPLSVRIFETNYCYIRDFERYYFISDWIWNEGIWTAELEVDPLASFKTQIGQQTVYVLRSSSTSDGNIIDTTYPATGAAATYSSNSVSNPFLLDASAGTYICGIVNKNADGGSVTYYAFNRLGFKNFCEQLYTYSSGWLDIDVQEISENLQKALVNPFQYVTTSFFIPIPVSWFVNNNVGTVTSTVDFGWWSVTLQQSCRIIPVAALFSSVSSLAIPRHPLAATRGAYLNISPYSYYTLRFYPFGTIDLDSEAIANWNTIDLYVDVDVCTGSAALNIAVNGKNNPIRTLSANVAVQIPTAAVNVDYLNLGTKSTAVMAAANTAAQMGSGSGTFWSNLKDNAKGFIGNIRSGNFAAVGQAAKNVISNITSAALASKATVEITGQQGTYSLYASQQLTLSGRFLPVVDEDISHRGRPLCRNAQISTLSGFILCADADVSISCTDRELSSIKAYLESGFYYL